MSRITLQGGREGLQGAFLGVGSHQSPIALVFGFSRHHLASAPEAK